MTGQAVEASLQTTNNSSHTTVATNQPALPTFLDHIHELRGRLFWIAVIFILTSIAAYPFLDPIITFLVAPLKGQQLYYLTPVGGFSFMIKISTYVGAVLTLPAIIFHLYRYLQPAVGQIKKRLVFSYVMFSAFLALAGIAFAYYISLPAALYFLTGLDLSSVTAMLTIDSYYSFIMTYMIGAALLFQLPLILLIINNVTPLRPSKLMTYQRHVILGAFIAAAIISPTPDMTNQALLAVPVILMYQVGIIMIWIRNKTKRRKQKSREKALAPVAVSAPTSVAPVLPVQPPVKGDKYAWIDDMLEEESQQAVRQPAVVHAQPKQPQVQPVSLQQPASAVLAQKPASRGRGYVMEFAASTRSVPRVSPRQLPSPTVRKTATSPAATRFASSVQNAAPAKTVPSVRYIDGVSVSLRSSI